MSRLPATERRKQLLDTAARLFAERGYARATTAEIARAAQVTEPIIYRHFSSKKELFIALINRTGEETLRLWKQQLHKAPDPAERLRRLIGANPLVSNRGRGAYRVIVQAMTEISDPDILAALAHHIRVLHEFVAGEVVAAQEAGFVSERFSASITAWMLLHLGLGYGVLAPLDIPGHAQDESGVRVREVIEQLMLGDSTRQAENLRKHARRAAEDRGDAEDAA
ncbi:MAG: TetR/AcrR family transcriptional regulator [Planctomycetota bacterium]|nr:MAG: TetR/AcrR family transcriptional regulator [Planctomycetota bacterium]